MIDRIVVGGGGSGGHLFPGLALIEELRRRLPELDVLFVGTERGMEARILRERGERFQSIEVKPLVGRSPGELAKNLAALPRAGLHALGIVRSFRPDLALGLGGYVSGPVLLAASALRVPSALINQDFEPGLANRLLSHSVGRAYVSFEETVKYFGKDRARVLGNPIRRAFVDAARMAAHDPIGAAARARSVFVLGGSQGARKLNQIVPDALARAGVRELGIAIVHQTGSAMVDAVKARYRELGLEAEVVAFIDDVARCYLDASLVIGRAGAGTLAELCAIGRASILVPLPIAGKHQLDNARALERAGAALALPEPELSVEQLARHVAELLRDPVRRAAMADAARKRGRPDAAAAIVDDLMDWLEVPNLAPPETPPTEASPDSSVPSSGTDAGSFPNALAAPVRRKPRVKRAELRVRPVAARADAAEC